MSKIKELEKRIERLENKKRISFIMGIFITLLFPIYFGVFMLIAIIRVIIFMLIAIIRVIIMSFKFAYIGWKGVLPFSEISPEDDIEDINKVIKEII